MKINVQNTNVQKLLQNYLDSTALLHGKASSKKPAHDDMHNKMSARFMLARKLVIN